MVEEASTSSALPPALPALSALPPAASITDLRDRMRAKLDGYKRARGIDDNEDPQSRDALEAARRQRRGEIRDKRRKERKEERKKARVEVTAKTAKVSHHELKRATRRRGGWSCCFANHTRRVCTWSRYSCVTPATLY